MVRLQPFSRPIIYLVLGVSPSRLKSFVLLSFINDRTVLSVALAWPSHS